MKYIRDIRRVRETEFDTQRKIDILVLRIGSLNDSPSFPKVEKLDLKVLSKEQVVSKIVDLLTDSVPERFFPHR